MYCRASKYVEEGAVDHLSMPWAVKVCIVEGNRPWGIGVSNYALCPMPHAYTVVIRQHSSGPAGLPAFGRRDAAAA